MEQASPGLVAGASDDSHTNSWWGNAGASGVAHDITIAPITTAKATSLPSPVTVEVR
jgi:hypothetical protein